MANVYKVLGQVSPTATTNTTLYTVPAATSAVCSTLIVCNRNGSTSFRVAIRPAGATLADEHYIIYDSYINSYDTLFFTLGITLSATDVVTVYADTAVLSFSLYGTEIS